MLTTMLTFALAAIPQNTWTVDANNGPGTDFTDLPPAVAAAQSGDTIRMRPGIYSGATVSGKALTISGPAQLLSGLTFENQPPSTTTYLSSLWLTGLGGIELNDAIAVLQDVVSQPDLPQFPTAYASAGVTIRGSVVHVSRCRFDGAFATLGTGSSGFGAPGAVILDSRVFADDCEFRGSDTPVFWPWGAYPGDGVAANRSEVLLTNCACRGADASTTAGAGDGIYCLQSSVRIAGASSVTAGGGSIPGVDAVACTASTITCHFPFAGTSSGNVLLDPRTMPRLDVTGASTTSGALDAMQPISIDYDGVIPNAPYFFVVGFAPDFSDAFAPLLLGPMLIDLSTASLQLGTLDATASFSGSLVPANVLGPLTALPLHAQAGTFDFNTGEFRVSNGTVTRFE